LSRRSPVATKKTPAAKAEGVEEEEGRGEASSIFIGRKPMMSYALAALLQFDAGGKEVVLKARGRAISLAVDVAEVIKRRLMPDNVEVKNISIGTEVLGEDNRNVSIIEIVLAKKH
jgi:DNA-binding protein